jgi:hypothetical protein
MQQPLSYRSRRPFRHIDVTVDRDDTVRWSYARLHDEFRQQVPLTSLAPHPVTTIERQSWKLDLVGYPILIAAAALLIWATGLLRPILLVAGCIAAYSFWYIYDRRRYGPMEWVTFQSYQPNGEIYLFRNKDDLTFDSFVETMSERIEAAHARRCSKDPTQDG